MPSAPFPQCWAPHPQMKGNTVINTNSGIARQADAVIAALAECDHLPRIGLINIADTGKVFLSTADYGHKGIVAVGRWAAAFNAPAVLSVTPNQEVRTHVRMGSIDVQVWVNLASNEVHELAVRLDQAVTPDGVSVSAEHLLTALHVEVTEAETAPVCDDEQCIPSGRAALCATHDTEYFAGQRATVSAVEIAAGGAL